MPFVGSGHIWILGILLVIVLVIWGPGKLPDVGSGMGRAIREFRRTSTDAGGGAGSPAAVADVPAIVAVHPPALVVAMPPPPPAPPVIEAEAARG